MHHGGHEGSTELNPRDGSVSLFNQVIAGFNMRSGRKVHRWVSAVSPGQTAAARRGAVLSGCGAV